MKFAGSVKDFDLKPVSQALRDYYHTMRSLDHTTQVETWTGMNTFQALRSSVQSGGQVYEQVGVGINVYMNQRILLPV